MVDTLRTVVAGTPLRWCILGAGMCALAAQIWLMLEALRRRKRQRKLRLIAEVAEWERVAMEKVPRPVVEIVALLALLMVPAATVASVEHARDLVRASFLERAPAAHARLLWDGWRGQLRS